MKKSEDPIESIFERLDNQWDTELPNFGHADRFMEKLNRQPVQKKKNNWKLFAIAASLFLTAGLITFYQYTNKPVDQWENASVQTKETHDYFASVVEKELAVLKANQTKETEPIIADALKQMKVFESDYQKIIIELQKNGDTKQILYAMIVNFQTRISFLEDIIKQIEIINHQNTIQNEKSS
ncbi:MAG TPA: anti-sigma factor [Flavobacterium sp.]|mgnify:FL=1|nr:anti-sigma factor [Flavobacterium sp.]